MRITIRHDHYIHFVGEDIAERVERLEARGEVTVSELTLLQEQVARLDAQNGILTAAFTGLSGDLQAALDRIAALEADGVISATDAAALRVSLTSAVDRTSQVASDLAALDAQNPAPGA